MYWRSTAISVLAETDLSGNNPVEFIYFAGQRVALRDASGAVFFIYSDHLGSARVITDATGNPCRDVDYFPYGGERITLNTCPLLTYNFATYERDPESGLDYAIFRYYNSRVGRFMSPDILAGGVDDPQSLNRYAYVLNDPVNLVDPLGLVCTQTGPDTFNCPVWEDHPDIPNWDGFYSLPTSPNNLNGVRLSVVDQKRELTFEQGGPHLWSRVREFVQEAVDKATDVLAANANYLPGLCGAGAFGFAGGSAEVGKLGTAGAGLADVNISPSRDGIRTKGSVEPLVEGFHTKGGGVGVTPTEALVFVPLRKTSGSGSQAEMGAVFAADHRGEFPFFNNEGISMGVYGEVETRPVQLGPVDLHGVAGGGAYVTFSSAANCVQQALKEP